MTVAGIMGTPARPPCTATAAAPPHDRHLCRCGAVLHPVPRGDHDWRWVDQEGHLEVDRTPPGLVEDPEAWWAALAARDIHTYSSLRAQLALGCNQPWVHIHNPYVRITDPPPPELIPWCCATPMHATPTGWRCRVTGTTNPYTTDERNPS